MIGAWCKKGGSRGYVVTAAFEWEIGRAESGRILAVPVGREFESSVPRCLQWLWSPDDPYFLKAAVVHDMLLEEGNGAVFSDSQWFDAAASVGAPMWRTWLAYGAMVMRRFLQWVFRKFKKREAAL